MTMNVYFVLLVKIEALREYFKSKKAKLDDSITVNDIPEHLRDLIKNLDSLYTSDIADAGWKKYLIIDF